MKELAWGYIVIGLLVTLWDVKTHVRDNGLTVTDLFTYLFFFWLWPLLFFLLLRGVYIRHKKKISKFFNYEIIKRKP